MKMFSDCSGECCLCSCGGGCLAGHGDDDFYPATNEQIISRLNNGEYPNYRQTMIGELIKRGVVCIKPTSASNDLRQKVIEVLNQMDYENTETVNVEVIADKVLETICYYLKGGAENG